MTHKAPTPTAAPASPPPAPPDLDRTLDQIEAALTRQELLLGDSLAERFACAALAGLCANQTACSGHYLSTLENLARSAIEVGLAAADAFAARRRDKSTR